ncbi:MAG: hypothetical protein WC408_03240 [Candidatus Micrarchaeia archaeon]
MAFNRNQLILRLQELGLPKGKYVLLAGGAMVMHGLREQTNDLDILVALDVFEALGSKHGFVEPKGGKPKFVDLGPDVELSGNSDNAFPTDSIARAVQIDGICVQPLEDILDFKKKLNRPKDLNDILILEAETNRRAVESARSRLP